MLLLLSIFCLRASADQQREATADLQLAADFIRQEYADQLGANYTQLDSVPLMLARIRRNRHRKADPAHPEVLFPDPSGVAPAASSVESIPVRRHRRPRRRRRGGIQQPDIIAVTIATPAAVPDSLRLESDRNKPTAIELMIEEDRDQRTEVTGTATADPTNYDLDELDAELVDERSGYAKTLLKIAHGLHYGSIAILGVFVVQV